VKFLDVVAKWGCGGSVGDVVAQWGCGNSDGDVVAQTGTCCFNLGICWLR
jgi:hypothetical protein